jgi:hypothetical protein
MDGCLDVSPDLEGACCVRCGAHPIMAKIVGTLAMMEQFLDL